MDLHRGNLYPRIKGGRVSSGEEWLKRHAAVGVIYFSFKSHRMKNRVFFKVENCTREEKR